MAVKIRMKRLGRRNRPFYRLVAIDSRKRRDGKAIEELGWYNPILQTEKNYELKTDRILYWLEKGAQPSERAQKILEISGAWAQWRSSKGEVVSIPTPPEPKIKSSSKAHNKKNEDQAEDTNEESTDEGNKGEEE